LLANINEVLEGSYRMVKPTCEIGENCPWCSYDANPLV